MPTINDRAFVDKLIALDGRYPGDPPILLITEYTTYEGGTAYGLDYRLPTSYYPSRWVQSPKVIFRATRR